MWIVWVVVGAGVVGVGLGLWLVVRAVRHRRGRGRVFGILAGVSLILAAIVLFACYLPVFVLPDVAAESAVFNEPAPVAADATVFYLSPALEGASGTPHASSDVLIAVAARTGAIRWQRTLPGTRSQFAVEGDIAFVATLLAQAAGGIRAVAYRGADGALLWQSTVAGSALPRVGLAAAGDAVYLLTEVGQPTSQTEIIALGAADGSRLWSAMDAPDVNASNETLSAAPDAVYLTATTGLQVYRAGDGKLLWTHPPLASHPVAITGVAYLPLSRGGFTVVRAGDGSVICQVGGSFEVLSAGLDGDTLYLSGIIVGPENPPYPSAVYAYDAATCTPRWHVANVGGELVAGSGVVYIEALINLTALRGSDGKVLWRSASVTSSLAGTGWSFAAQPSALGSTLFATSAVLGGGIQVLGHDGWIHLYAFAAGSGFEYWHEPVGHRTTFLAHLSF